MKLKYKKIIAREFLVLFFCAVLSLLIFFSVELYNSAIEKSIENKEKKVVLIEESNQEFLRKVKIQKKTYNVWVEDFFPNSSPYYKKYSDYWSVLEKHSLNDSISYKWNNTWGSNIVNHFKNTGFKRPKELNRFIKQNSFTGSEKQIQSKISKIEEEIKDKKNSLLEYYERQDIFIGLSLGLLVIAFPLRYLYYALRWSFRTLKQK